MNQIFLAVFGLMAVYLTQQPRRRWQRWACVFGVAGQPFWIYFAWASPEAWGVRAIVLAYSYVWLLGFYNNWIKEKPHNCTWCHTRHRGMSIQDCPDRSKFR